MVELAIAAAMLVFVVTALVLMRAAEERWAAYIADGDAAITGDSAEQPAPAERQSRPPQNGTIPTSATIR